MKTENLTREDVLKARETWINFLVAKDRKKAQGYLDKGGGERCCLGHACYILGAPKIKVTRPTTSATYDYEGDESYPSENVVTALGLWNKYGGTNDNSIAVLKIFKNDELNRSSLADVNDETSAGPNRIGKYLRSVIEGGEDTPFRPLSEYPSAMPQ